MPARNIPKDSVWTAMSYTPPRGRCNFKASLMSPACPCLRFMLHPVKAATSFECDGCCHHASFHTMENAAEDAVATKWAAQEAEEGKKNGQATGAAGRKRRRIADRPANETEEVVTMREVLEIEDGEETEAGDDVFRLPTTAAMNGATGTTAGASKKRPGRNAHRQK